MSETLDRMFAKLNEANEVFDAAIESTDEGSTPEELKLTTPHDPEKLEAFIVELRAQSKESSEAAFRAALAFVVKGIGTAVELAK